MGVMIQLIRKFDEIIAAAKGNGGKTISVAVAQDREVLMAIKATKDLGIADAILVGDKEAILKEASNIKMDLTNFELIDVKDKKEACKKAVALVSEGRAQILMKGIVDTSIILKAALEEKAGLRTGNILSHVAVFEVDQYDRLFYITDPGMNIAPNLEQKKQLIENVVKVANALGNSEPKVAILAAVEKVNPKMPATLDAEALVNMQKDGEIKGCIVGGPFALDNAVSIEAAKHKGIEHPVAGNADILLVPTIEAGNILYKAITFLAGGKSSGIVVGARVPLIVTSRADSEEAKLNSIAIAALIANL